MKVLKNILLLFSISALILNSCKESEPVYQNIVFRGEIFGTIYSISYFSTNGVNYKEDVDSIFNDFNNSLSYYKKNSLISKINRNETDIADKYFENVFTRAIEVSKETDGYFDVTVSPLVNLWGFGFEKKGIVTKSKIDSILKFVGYEKVRLENEKVLKEDDKINFDFNAIAKGYAADVIGEYLEKQGVNIYMVEIGGDLITRGKKPDGTKWRIGIEKPAKTSDSPQDWQFLLEIHNQAIATSGSYRRYYEGEDGLRYSHTINPKTGYPVAHNLISTTVVAKDGMSADAYATAFMAMGLEKAIEFVESREDLEAFFIYSNVPEKYKTRISSGLNITERHD